MDQATPYAAQPHRSVLSDQNLLLGNDGHQVIGQSKIEPPEPICPARAGAIFRVEFDAVSIAAVIQDLPPNPVSNGGCRLAVVARESAQSDLRFTQNFQGYPQAPG